MGHSSHKATQVVSKFSKPFWNGVDGREVAFCNMCNTVSLNAALLEIVNYLYQAIW